MKRSFAVVLFLVATIFTQNVAFAEDADFFEESAKVRQANGGVLPSIQDEKTYDYSKNAKLLDVLPIKYDLRDYNRVTSVKNQGMDNTCWAFAAISAAESSLLRSNATDTNAPVASPRPTFQPVAHDLSESHLKHSITKESGEWGFNMDMQDGGNSVMAIAYYARLSGAVLESNDPFVAEDAMRTDAFNKSITPDKYLEKAMFIPKPVTASEFYYMGDVNYRNTIKQSIMDYGAIHASMFADFPEYINQSGTYYNHLTGAYLYNGIEEGTNHAINIIGWDDNYSRDNFASTNKPVSNGAFIIKNSWGTGFGKSGYFYISYEDKHLGFGATVYSMTPAKHSYKGFYQYDPLGMNSGLGYATKTSWFANVFNVKQPNNEYLTSVGFYANDVNTYYELYYTTMESGVAFTNNISMIKVASGTVPYPGYYSIDLADKRLLDKAKYAVAVKVINPTSTLVIPTEKYILGYTDYTTASVGQSYIRTTDTGSWTDITTLAGREKTNVCVKAFTTDAVEYRAVFDKNALTVGEAVSGRVYCNNSTGENQTPVMAVAFYSNDRLIKLKILAHTFDASVNSWYSFSFLPELPVGTNYSTIKTKIIVASPFGTSFSPLMSYSEEMKK